MNDARGLSLPLMTRGDVDVIGELVGCLRAAYGDEYADPPDDARLRAMSDASWSSGPAVHGGHTVYRVRFTPDVGEDGDGAVADRLMHDFRKEVRDTRRAAAGRADAGVRRGAVKRRSLARPSCPQTETLPALSKTLASGGRQPPDLA